MASLPRRLLGFTLIELIVVMLIIAMLASLAVPRYFGSVQKSKDAVLKENLTLMRDALDKFYGDNDKYPATLDDLVSRKYLRNIPRDPVTESTSTWITVPPEDPDKGGVYDVHSGAEGNAADGSPYKEW
ncbi:type IV pilin protein [Sideroxydans lithotrophicus]|uniref:Type II secretion system protein G n=1 Tax=Sideroxydans lithotrophicus (strain ES-1) TaxID=580332 RepID=D5CSW6_SIDLE|nr:prepilin-type N-terminal cleavage/methylation domain-containing protein [Sideroxydans lithotrophicus]ADE12052.1 type II secretion system protein G [Sideroxydans lithotrophicus ES-1]